MGKGLRIKKQGEDQNLGLLCVAVSSDDHPRPRLISILSLGMQFKNNN